ncbi:hypothetical protein D3C80_1456620 [compost metagenome]
MGDVFPDGILIVWAAVQNGAVGQHQTEGGVVVKGKGVVKLAEIIDIQRCNHHAGKAAIRMVQAA